MCLVHIIYLSSIIYFSQYKIKKYVNLLCFSEVVLKQCQCITKGNENMKLWLNSQENAGCLCHQLQVGIAMLKSQS